MFRQIEHCPACRAGYKKRRGLTCPHCRVQLVHRGESWDLTEPAWLRAADGSWTYQAPEDEPG